MGRLLLVIPGRLRTARLALRLPLRCVGRAVVAAVCESIEQLKLWMPWARKPPTLEESEIRCRKVIGNFYSRFGDLSWHMHLGGDDGPFVGCVGIHDVKWDVPCCEIGYWLHSAHAGRGYMTEAVVCLTRMLFETLKAVRVEIRMDDRNERSWRVAERAGFALDGILRNNARTPEGELRDSRVYSRVQNYPDSQDLPSMAVGGDRKGPSSP